MLHKDLFLWQLVKAWLYTLLNYLSPQRFKHNQSLELILYIAFWGLFTQLICHQCVFWTKFSQMTWTSKVGRSRLFEYFIKICLKVSTFDINRHGPSVHRITTKNHDIFIGPIYSKAVAFDLYQLMKPNLMAYINNDFLKQSMAEHEQLENK